MTAHGKQLAFEDWLDSESSLPPAADPDPSLVEAAQALGGEVRAAPPRLHWNGKPVRVRLDEFGDFMRAHGLRFVDAYFTWGGTIVVEAVPEA